MTLAFSTVCFALLGTVGFLSGVAALLLTGKLVYAVVAAMYAGLTVLCVRHLVWLKRTRHRVSSRTACRAQVTLPGDRAQVFEACLAGIKAIGARDGETGTEQSEISARLPWTWKSGGELIRVVITPDQASAYRVRVVSDAAQPTTLLDSGENVKNVQQFIDSVCEGLPGNPG